ncbi:MAG: tetratricopeptide repeat protein [Candidatus Sumerlaeia bacterium]
MAQWMALVAMIAAAAGARAETAQEYNTRGIQQLDAGKFQGAVDSFSAARRLLPQDATIQRNLAMAYNGWGVELARQANYADAIKRLQSAILLAPQETGIPANLTAIRVNWAGELTQGKRYDDAETQLRLAAQETQAETLRREITKRRGYNAYMIAKDLIDRGDKDRGTAQLDAALRIDPDCTHALIKLAQLQYENGNTGEAIEAWQRAAAIDPGIQGLSEMLAKATREASVESNFNQRSSRDFNVSYEGTVNEQAAREALQILSRALFQIRRDLRYNGDKSFAVVLYQRDQYEAATGGPTWSAGLYDGKIRVPLRGGNMTRDDMQALTRTLRHELTHAIVNDLAPRQVPAWLNEGLAMYYEVEDAERARRAQADRQKIARMAGRGANIAVLGLPASFTSITNENQVEQAYLFSRSFVYWMAERWRPWKFKDLLAELGEGAAVEDAVRKVYGCTPEEMEKTWVNGI